MVFILIKKYKETLLDGKWSGVLGHVGLNLSKYANVKIMLSQTLNFLQPRARIKHNYWLDDWVNPITY